MADRLAVRPLSAPPSAPPSATGIYKGKKGIRRDKSDFTWRTLRPNAQTPNVRTSDRTRISPGMSDPTTLPWIPNLMNDLFSRALETLSLALSRLPVEGGNSSPHNRLKGTGFGRPEGIIGYPSTSCFHKRIPGLSRGIQCPSTASSLNHMTGHPSSST